MTVSLHDEKLKSFIIFNTFKKGNCWEWKKSVNTSGNPQIIYNGKQMLVHRLMYSLYLDSISPKMVITHLCRNPKCVNPNHLQQITKKENILRGDGPTAINKRKTQCKRGHLLTGYNLIIREKGRRACRECKKQWSRGSKKQRYVS